MPGECPKPDIPSPVETEILRIRGLMEQRQFAPALAAAEALAVDYPQNRDALYMMAVCQRYLDRVPDALATLARLEKWHPKFSRLFQERGYCHVARREAEPAIQAFVRAVNLNHALAASWKALQTLFRITRRKALPTPIATSPSLRSYLRKLSLRLPCSRMVSCFRPRRLSANTS
jgi:tetratricopeptide (TPR) repeat protein